MAMAIGSAAVPLSAQQQPPQRPEAVNRFDEQTIRFLLTDVQATWTVEQNADGTVNYRASAEGGINFVMAPRACDAEAGCVGLVLIAVFTGINARDPAQLDTFVHRFNDTYPTAKVIRNPDGVLALQAYINAARGISYGNAQAQLLVFGQDISNLSRALTQFESEQ